MFVDSCAFDPIELLSLLTATIWQSKVLNLQSVFLFVSSCSCDPREFQSVEGCHWAKQGYDPIEVLRLWLPFDKQGFESIVSISVFVDSCARDPIELLSLLTAAMGDQQVDEPDKQGDTPLHLAAANGATICCMHLLQVGG